MNPQKTPWFLCCITPKSPNTPHIKVLPGPPIFPAGFQVVILGIFKEKKHAEFVFMYKTPDKLLEQVFSDEPVFFEYRGGRIFETRPPLMRQVPF